MCRQRELPDELIDIIVGARDKRHAADPSSYHRVVESLYTAAGRRSHLSAVYYSNEAGPPPRRGVQYIPPSGAHLCERSPVVRVKVEEELFKESFFEDELCPDEGSRRGAPAARDAGRGGRGRGRPAQRVRDPLHHAGGALPTAET